MDDRRPGKPRLDPAAVRRLLPDAAFRPRHALSQNFLADVEVLERILDEASPTPGRRILEIGPGLGILTGGLLDAGASVTAVELDWRLAERLREHFAGQLLAGEAVPGAPGSLRLIEGDALDQDLAHLVPAPYEVVANLPYHITSPILHALLGEDPRPERLVLMVQREVAERIAASPGGMSYLSVFVQYHAPARIAFPVPRAAFEPQPDVESALIVLEPRPSGPSASGTQGGRLPTSQEDDFWRLVQAGFRERRKMLKNVLVRQLPVEQARLEPALAENGIAGERRPQTLSVDEWLGLYHSLGALGPDVRGRRAEHARA